MYRSAARLVVFPLLVTAALYGSSCQPRKAVIAESTAVDPLPAEHTTEVTLPELEGPATAYVAQLSGNTAGKGFILFPPVMSKPTDNPEFATGCARWLNLNVGGAPELTKSPLWHTGDTLPVYLERDNLRLTPAEAQKAAAMVGATHYAVGEAEANKLSFQVYDRHGQKVGAPMTLSGTPAQIAAGLPQAASTLRERLGLAAKTPKGTGETPEDLALLGRVPIEPGMNISEADAVALHKLSQRSPLAGLLYVATYARTESHPEPDRARVLRLLGQANNNPLILSYLALNSSEPETRLAMQKAAPVIGKSLAYAWGKTALVPSRAEQITAAENAVKAAPESADAWVLLSQTQGDNANDVRRGRTSDQLGPEDARVLEEFYGKQLVAAVKAASLNPESGTAFLELSTSAAFAGDRELAQKAIDRSMDFAMRRRAAPRVFFWALELSAPKWGGSLEKQQAVADRAATLPAKVLPQAIQIMKSLDAYDYKPQARKLATTILSVADEKLAKDPSSILAMDARKAALTKLNRDEEAIQQAKRCAELRPEDAGEQDDLAQCYRNARRFEEALTAQKKAMQLAPGYGPYALGLANTYTRLNRPVEAMASARKAVTLIPENVEALNALGTLEGMSGNLKGALAHFQKAHLISPADPLSMSNVGETLCRMGRVSEGRPMLEAAIERSHSSELQKNARAVLEEFPG